MGRWLAIILGLVGLLLVGVWARRPLYEIPNAVDVRLEQEEGGTRDPAARSPPPHQEENPPTFGSAFRQRLASERERLRDLRERLTMVQTSTSGTPLQPPTGDVEAHLENLRERLRRLQADLATVERSEAIAAENAQAYHGTQQLESHAEQVRLQDEIQRIQAAVVEITEQVQELQTQPSALNRQERLADLQAQVEVLAARRSQILAQIREIEVRSQAAAIQVTRQIESEMDLLRGRHEDLERQIEDLQDDIEYWQGRLQNAAPSADGRSQRIRKLQNAITLQEQVVRALEQQL
ncbi:MAG: hypothetical protein AB7G93_14135 [Bdellovibrionales bacterium]